MQYMPNFGYDSSVVHVTWRHGPATYRMTHDIRLQDGKIVGIQEYTLHTAHDERDTCRGGKLGFSIWFELPIDELVVKFEAIESQRPTSPMPSRAYQISSRELT